MVEFQRNPDRESTALPPLKICVVGVGGGGLNVLDRICLDRLMDATLVSMHTDVRVLGHAMAPLKIQLGSDMMRGIGCGGDPELGREAAEASSAQIKAALQGHDMIFICTGLGGGTGSGAAPVVAELARELGAMVFIFATMPFSFEGRRRLSQAEMALEDLQRSADAVILFENNRMGELVLPKEGIQKAFSQADQLIGHSVRAISTMVLQPGVVRMGLADLMTALRSPNARCLFGFGEARGTNRVQDALKRALKSPLVNQGQLLQTARNLLVHIAGGETLTLAEVESLMKQLGKYVPESTQIMFGLAVDPKLGDMMTVTLISSLSAQEMSLDSAAPALQPQAQPRVAARPVVEAAPQPAPAPPVVESVAPAPPVVSRNGQGSRAAAATPAAAPQAAHEELFSAFLESSAPATPPARPQRSAPVISVPMQTEEPEPEAELEEPQTVEAEVEEEPVAPAPVQRPARQATPEPIEAPAPVARVEEPVKVEVAPPIKAASIHVQQHPETLEEEEVVAEPVVAKTQAKPSIFSLVEEEDEELEDEEDDSAEAFENQAADEADLDEEGDVIVAEAPAEDPESRGTHWADKYIQPKPAGPAIIEPRQEPQRTLQTTAAVATKKTVEPKQPSLNLQQPQQEEVARFKGTDKTIVDGDDLDIPTWMRLRGKVKRQ